MRSLSQPHDEGTAGFSLIELLVVVIIIGILAAIAVPRYLEQRQTAYNALAATDLRNLAVIETGLEATPGGLSDDPGVIAASGWEVSDPNVVVCADLAAGGTDITLTAWHASGSTVYTWLRSDARVVATTIAVPVDCAAATAGVTVS